MGTYDAARAKVRNSMRSGWALAAQREHYKRMLEEAQVRIQAIDDVAAEVEVAERHGEGD